MIRAFVTYAVECDRCSRESGPRWLTSVAAVTDATKCGWKERGHLWYCPNCLAGEGIDLAELVAEKQVWSIEEILRREG